jgi:DNA-binding transcriptional LysR family regulator
VNIYDFNLNLLLVFDALMEAHSVVGAAQRLGITQPAMSNALGRLRQAVGDPLFTRVGRQLVATPRAQRMAVGVRTALAAAQEVLKESPFTPVDVHGALRLGASDYWHYTLLPELLQVFQSEAPRLDLGVVDASESRVTEDLTRGRVDAVIYLAGVSAAGLLSQPLLSDDYVGVARRGHVAIRRGRPLSLADYATLRHVLIGPSGPWRDRLASALQAHGYQPRIVLENTHMHAALDIVARTDLVTILPRQLALVARRRWPVKLFQPPADLGSFSLNLYWHERTQREALHAWFRQKVLEIARKNYRLRYVDDPAMRATTNRQ